MKAYVFNEDQARRVGNVVNYVERLPIGDPSKGPANPVTQIFRRGKITTTITARSGDTPGEGTAVFNTYDWKSNTLGLSQEWTIKNDIDFEFDADSEAFFYWFAGSWWILAILCP